VQLTQASVAGTYFSLTSNNALPLTPRGLVVAQKREGRK
jgi:hypothetical protein